MRELVQPGGAREDCLEVCFVRLVVRGIYAWCFAIFVIFMRFGGAKTGDNTLKSSFGVEMQVTRTRREGGGTILMGKGGFQLYNTVELKIYCKSYWVL